MVRNNYYFRHDGENEEYGERSALLPILPRYSDNGKSAKLC